MIGFVTWLFLLNNNCGKIYERLNEIVFTIEMCLSLLDYCFE